MYCCLKSYEPTKILLPLPLVWERCTFPCGTRSFTSRST